MTLRVSYLTYFKSDTFFNCATPQIHVSTPIPITFRDIMFNLPKC